MKFILKGLISKDESASNKGAHTQILKKQLKALTLRSPTEAPQLEDAHSSIDTST